MMIMSPHKGRPCNLLLIGRCEAQGAKILGDTFVQKVSLRHWGSRRGKLLKAGRGYVYVVICDTLFVYHSPDSWKL